VVAGAGTALCYALAIFAGLLYTGATPFGVKGLEKVGTPAMVALVRGAVIVGMNGKPGAPLAILLARSPPGLLASVAIYVLVRVVEVSERAPRG
jgi:hypothetical protein